jgi:hypothetical protein
MATPSSGVRSSRRPVPSGVRPGAFTIVFGLVLDLSEHTFAAPSGGGFTPGQHTAHLVVLLGMVLILGAIVRDGVQGHGPKGPQEGSPRDAVR